MTIKKTVKKKSIKKKCAVKKKTSKNKVSKRKTAKKKAKKKTKTVKPDHPLMLEAHNGKQLYYAWDRVTVMNHINDCLVSSSKSIGTILKAGYNGYILPNYSTIMAWKDEDSGLSDNYARAKEAQADYMADEIIEIADHGAEDVLMVDGKPMLIDGKPITTKSAVGVNHARLMVDARKWVASKLKPKKYGDKIQQEVTGEGGGAIQHGIKVIYVKANKKK